MSFMNYDDAIAKLKSSFNSWNKIERISLLNSYDRFIANDIIADDNYPNKPRASMDGYAIKFGDLKKFKIIGLSPAEGFDMRLDDSSCCIKTMTGSVMPDGSDTIVPIENVEICGDFINVKIPVSKNFAVRAVGEGYKKGDILIKKGTRLDFAHIGLLASLGMVNVDIFIKPIVGILSSGSELCDLGESLSNNQIYSINNYAIASLMKEFGCDVRVFKILKDNKNQIDEIKQALSSCDILITTGGVSVGDFDYIKDAIKEFDEIINKVSIKPGRHIKISKFNDKFIFSLPGFPNSSLILCNLFVKPLINHYFHNTKVCEFNAFISADFKKKSQFIEFIPVNIINKSGKVFADFSDLKVGSSAIINNLCQKSLMRVDRDLYENDIVRIFDF